MTFKKFADELRVYFYAHLYHKVLFLYNYAAELNVDGHYVESQQIAVECDNLWADYDLQMLMADNCRQLQQYRATESYLKKAAAMCPIKFIPLFQLTELYQETGRKDEAHVLAHKILNKKVKIHSALISSIKNKMRKLLNETEGLDDSQQTNKQINSLMTPTSSNSRSNCLLVFKTQRALVPT